MNRTGRTSLCLPVVLSGACAFLGGERERLALALDGSDWRLGYSEKAKGGEHLKEFVRNGETVEKWTELVTVIQFPGAPSSSTPEGLMSGAKALMKQRCPDAEWNVLNRQRGAILYEWRTLDCPSDPNNHSVVRILDGKWNRWTLSYEIKAKEWPEAQRSRWIELFSAASVEAGVAN